MNKIFHFDASADHYVADAAVISCFDERIRQTVNKFLKRRGILRPDMIVVAGGAKALASPGNDCERDFILQQLRLSILLHNAGRVLLVTHSDCGAYGGLAAFGEDRARECTHHGVELDRARDLVCARFPETPVQCFFVNFEGVFAAGAESIGQST
jgi:carbonic anhydrase